METALHRNAFWLLGATVRDGRRRVVELAEGRMLELDQEICQKARSDLTNPRTRLSVEVAWLPGVSPGKATHLVSQILQNPGAIRNEAGLPTLAHANLMAAAFEALDEEGDSDSVAGFIQEIAHAVDEMSVGAVLRDINEDRIVAGFPEVMGEDLIEGELGARKRYYRTAIKNALNRLPTSVLVDVMIRAVEDATEGGECHAPELLDELVDTYAVEAQAFLREEAENVQKLIAAVRELATQGEGAVKPLIDRIEQVTHNWDRVAQPIQLSFKARGQDHQPSKELAYAIRSLAVDLFNEQDMLPSSQRLASLLQELFAELPEVAERVEQDLEALEDIFNQRSQAESLRKDWEREITYSAEVGAVFKSVLSISPNGVAWNTQHYSLDAITRVRWGATRHSVNGIPTGTTYTIAFGDSRSEAVVEVRRQEVFSSFIEKLYRAVGVRLLTEMLESLRSGEVVAFGDAIVRDTGVMLRRQKFWSASEGVDCTWHQTQIWAADGSFFIRANDDEKVRCGLSYIHTPNTHILEQAIRMAFKRGARRLSDVLK